MYRSILVPLDGTSFGEEALPLALEVARRTDAVLHLVHVHTPSAGWTPLEGMMPGATSPRSVSAVEDRQYLEAILRRLGGQTPITGDVRVLDGPVGRSIADSAREAGVDLVVMSTHGRTGLSRLWHHDVAGYLTRNLSVPVLAWPVHDEAPEFHPTRLGRVLVPLGGLPDESDILAQVGGFCAAFQASATLLQVVEPPTEVGYTLLGQDGHVNHFLLEDMDERARHYLEGAAESLRSRGVATEMAVAHSGNPARAILDYARESGADVIAMETHGLGTVRHLLAPSVVESVLHTGDLPVLLHHAGAAQPGERVYEDGIRSGMGWRRTEAAAQRS